MKFLVGERCVACRGDEPTATEVEIKAMMPQIPEWTLLEQDGIARLERTYRFKNFRQALDFTNQVGEIAEEEGHHPVLQTEWGRTTVTWYTHKIKGLHRNDFIMAAKTDRIAEHAPATT